MKKIFYCRKYILNRFCPLRIFGEETIGPKTDWIIIQGDLSEAVV